MEKFHTQYCGAKQNEWYENHGSHLIKFKRSGLFGAAEIERYKLHMNMDIKEVIGGDSGYVRVQLKDTGQEETFHIYQKAKSLGS